MTTENILSLKVKKSKKEYVTHISYYYPELNRNREEEINDIPHQDFNTALMSLSEYLAYIFHASESMESYVATGFKYIKDNIVMISGRMVSDSGQLVGISTPQINLEEDYYGFENELQQKLDVLASEALMFLNGSKVGVKQLTIEDSVKQNEETEKNVQELNDELEDGDIDEEPEEEEELDEEEITEETREEEDDALNNDPPDNDEFLNDLIGKQ